MQPLAAEAPSQACDQIAFCDGQHSGTGPARLLWQQPTTYYTLQRRPWTRTYLSFGEWTIATASKI